MASFKVPCPSCEAQVLIKNPNLIGTKVECPKCKYRFKVEEPKDAAAGGDKKPDDAKPKKAKKPVNKKVLAGVGIGVVAVLVLAGVGYMVLGGGKKKENVGGGFVGPGPRPAGGGGDGKEEEKDKPKPKEKKVRIPEGTTAITNLAHPDSEAVFRFDVERMKLSAFGPQLFDAATRRLFHDSMGFHLDEVSGCFYCAVGKERLPFVVVQVRSPRTVGETEKLMKLSRPQASFGDRKLYEVGSNPFVTAVANTFSMQSLFADYLAPAAAPKAATAAEEKPLGACVYDTQTVLIGDLTVLDDYLKNLGPDGFPRPSGAEAPAKDKDGNPVAAAPDEAGIYQALEPGLRRAMFAMEKSDAPPAIVVWAEKFDPKRLDPKRLKDDHKPIADTLADVFTPAERIRYYGVRVSELDRQRMHLLARLFLNSEGDAPGVLKALAPKLRLATTVASLVLSPSPTKDDTPIQFVDYTGTTSDTGTTPGGIGPTGAPGSSGTPALPGPGSSSSGPRGGGPAGPPIGSASSPGGPRGGPAGEGGGPGPGGFQPGPMGPGGPGGEQGTQPGDLSHVDLTADEGTITVVAEIKWKDPVFNQVVYPRLKQNTDTLKGQLEVRSGFYDPHVLAKTPIEAAKVKDTAKREDYNAFPRGTVYRQADGNIPIPAPPEQRISFFANLLPYMGRDPRVSTTGWKAAWYAPENAEAAGQWVPELLVPYYPASSWRVESPFAPGRTLGGTNYVGIAGRGVNAARLNPADPNDQKLMGMTGYEWNSTPAEVKDGLSNTIYLMQVKPGIGRPYLAGGGATLMGVNETGNPMDDFAYTHPGRTKPGAHALMGDGSVRYIPADIKKDVFLGMSTRAGGGKEPLPGEDAPLVPAPSAIPLMNEVPVPPEKKEPEKK